MLGLGLIDEVKETGGETVVVVAGVVEVVSVAVEAGEVEAVTVLGPSSVELDCDDAIAEV